METSHAASSSAAAAITHTHHSRRTAGRSNRGCLSHRHLFSSLRSFLKFAPPVCCLCFNIESCDLLSSQLCGHRLVFSAPQRLSALQARHGTAGDEGTQRHNRVHGRSEAARRHLHAAALGDAVGDSSASATTSGGTRRGRAHTAADGGRDLVVVPREALGDAGPALVVHVDALPELRALHAALDKALHRHAAQVEPTPASTAPETTLRARPLTHTFSETMAWWSCTCLFSRVSSFLHSASDFFRRSASSFTVASDASAAVFATTIAANSPRSAPISCTSSS